MVLHPFPFFTIRYRLSAENSVHKLATRFLAAFFRPHVSPLRLFGLPHDLWLPVIGPEAQRVAKAMTFESYLDPLQIQQLFSVC